MKILVTGGAGYIGSHFVKLLAENGFTPVIIDNLSRGHIEALPRGAEFENIDLLNSRNLIKAVGKYKPGAIVHFAAFAYVGESVRYPDIYYRNNVIGSYNLLEAAVKNDVTNFVFSSTCSIYGNPERVPIDEKQPANPINPYANTKYIIEKMLSDYEGAFGLKHVCLRYFNAAGAAVDGKIGESHDPETHLIPLVLQSALGSRGEVSVFGNDYDTADGTCIRDYIHVEDLASAHLKAIEYLAAGNQSEIINLGTGKGNSVLEIIEKAGVITGEKIPYSIIERRPGDPAVLVADNKKAGRLLHWTPRYFIEEILESAWRWHINPKY